MQYAGFPFIRVGLSDQESHGDVVIKHLSMNQLGFIGVWKERKYFLFAGLCSSVQLRVLKYFDSVTDYTVLLKLECCKELNKKGTVSRDGFFF
jgi:hypothetical protein